MPDELDPTWRRASPLDARFVLAALTLLAGIGTVFRHLVGVVVQRKYQGL